MKKYGFFIFSILVLFAPGCKHTNEPIEETWPETTYSDIQHTFGYGVLNRVKGIWNGPVTSTTALGGYAEWIVDFRPISSCQISAKNELDTLNSIHMTFFIAKYHNEYRVCFRNGGSFNGMTRVSYFLADSVHETSQQQYYRFSEVVKGSSRAYTEVIFRNDSLLLASYTNKYNTLTLPTLHMSWSAKLQDTTSCTNAVNIFTFPQKQMAKDFSSSFTGQEEAVYYSISGTDPYDEASQPYLGQSLITYNYQAGYTPDPSKKVMIIITTQPLISGFSINLANMKFRSRYVILSATDQDFVFNYMHPGNYYLYTLYDADGNMNFSSGDWVSASNTTFSLDPLTQTSASTLINFVVP